MKTRVLFVNPTNKVLKLTIKPLMISEDLNILSSYKNIDKSMEYYGTIVSENDFGFTVAFFNNVKGFLTYKDIEDSNNISRKNYKVGQTIKVFIGYV